MRSMTITIAGRLRDIEIRTLATRAAVQTAGLFVPFVLIFVSAGTIHFWQGWLFWLSFSGSSIATGVYLLKHDPALLERRMRYGPRAKSRPSQKIIAAIILAVFAALLIVPGLDYRFGWSRVPAAIVVIANLLIIAVFGFFLLVLRENTFAASTVTVEAGQRVISSGYARVRHPMNAGALLLIFAIPLALGSLLGLLIAAIAIPVLIARILDEERTLSAELSGYDDYRRIVHYRLIPLVW
jgi:protein-S-isoprenylcysteine O-methyltransferase Ste14